MPADSIFNGQVPASMAEAKKILHQYYDAVHAEFSDVAINDVTQANIERRIINSHIEFLLLKGKEKVDAQRKYLLAMWHSDNINRSATPAMQFLEKTLGADHCYKLVDICVERIKVRHDPYAYEAYMDAEDEKKDKTAEWVQDMIKKSFEAPTYSERLFYRSAIAFFQNTGKYAEALPGNKAGMLALAALLAPLLGSAYCISFFADEIMTGIGLSMIVRYSSRKFEKSAEPSHKTLAMNAKHFAENLMYFSASIPVIMASGSYSVARHYVSCIREAVDYVGGDERVSAEDIKKHIQIIPLRLIASPLENYVANQEQQFAAGYRDGASKSLIINSAVNEMKNISEGTDTLFDKLDRVSAVLAAVRVNPVVNGSGVYAVRALDAATEELERARRALTSAEDRRYYESYHGMVLPLQDYLKDYATQWVASWRKNANAAKLIKTTTTKIDNWHAHNELSKDERLGNMRDVLAVLSDEMAKIKADSKAMQAVNDALAAAPAPTTVPQKSSLSYAALD